MTYAVFVAKQDVVDRMLTTIESNIKLISHNYRCEVLVSPYDSYVPSINGLTGFNLINTSTRFVSDAGKTHSVISGSRSDNTHYYDIISYYSNGFGIHKVGICTSEPSEALHVKGNVLAESGAIITKTNNAATSSAQLVFKHIYNGNEWSPARIINDNYGGIDFNNGIQHGMHFVGGREDVYSNFVFRNNSGNQLAVITKDGDFFTSGNIGVGTNAPTVKLEVNGTAKAKELRSERSSMVDWYNQNAGYSNSSIVMNGVRENNQWKVLGDGARSTIGMITTDILSNMRFVTHRDDSYSGGKTLTDEELILDNTKMIISSTGNVGIGTTTPQAKLDVFGTIRATEIKVEANGQTADFVFDSSCQLRNLQEEEAFIRENKHLPEIPSAKEMESNGVNLAERNKLLLQKIEELTLYSITLEKASKSLEERLAKLEKLPLKE